MNSLPSLISENISAEKSFSQANGHGDGANSHRFQSELVEFNHRRLSPATPNANWRQELKLDNEMLLREGEMVEAERRKSTLDLSTVPSQVDAFLQWFENLKLVGPGQNDSLFEWLATQATREQMTWFIQQEVAGEAGFEDLVALTQVKIPTRPKLEMGRNFWDELGRGHEKGMHGPMLARLAEQMDVDQSPTEKIVTESLMLANLLTAFAANRRYAYHSIGALGVIELTAPARAKCVYLGLKRLGFAGDASQYYLLHSSLDIKHSKEWNAEVLYPLVQSNPSLAKPIAEGAWMRLQAGARCFARYRNELFSRQSN